ncbi:MAG: hypothetical protein ACFHHU_10810 [Porticoccaceae bacterium]
MKNYLFFALTLFLIPTSAFAQRCVFEKPIEFDIPVDGQTLLELTMESGNLVVEGNDESDVVEIRATACAGNKSAVEDLDLVYEGHSESIDIRSVTPDISSLFSFNNYAYIDTTITLPSDMDLSIDDGSGDITVRNIASLKIVDGSGNIVIDEHFRLPGSKRRFR